MNPSIANIGGRTAAVQDLQIDVANLSATCTTINSTQVRVQHAQSHLSFGTQSLQHLYMLITLQLFYGAIWQSLQTSHHRPDMLVRGGV